jgi:hypothetical protein
MTRFSISYQEVKEYVESLPKGTSLVGEVCDSQKCVIAQAIWKKYPYLVWVWVEPGKDLDNWIRVFTGNNWAGEVESHDVDTSEDDQRLLDVAKGFDHFQDKPTRTKTLKFFKMLEAA